MIESTFRFSTIRFDASQVEELGSGAVRINYARFARVGIITYPLANGEVWREYRSPEELFSDESLASYRGNPVTIDHPLRGGDNNGFVSPENWQALSVGHIADNVRRDGDYVVGSVVVSRQDAIQKVLSRELRELSSGYLTKPVIEEGEWNGQRFDARQTSIRSNHVAMVEAGRARGGSELRMRLDSNKEIIFEGREPRETEMKKSIELNGVVYRYDSEEAFEQAMQKELRAHSDTKTELEKYKGQIQAAEKENAELKKRLDALESPEHIEQIVSERVELLSKAAKLGLKTDDAKGLSAREIMVKALGQGFRHDAKTSDAFIQGAFDYAVSQAKEETRQDAIGDFSNEIGKSFGTMKKDDWDELEELERRADSTLNEWQKPKKD